VVRQVVEEMSMKERSALMKFATSISRAPLGGFQHLNPPFRVHKVLACALPLMARSQRHVCDASSM
jgi:hypothetical protein